MTMKKIIFFFFTTVLFVTQIGLQAQTSELPAGEGTEINPYRIANLNNLFWLSMNSGYWNSHFLQTADINAAETKNWDSGLGFSRIGLSGNEFTGTYHGGSHIIDSLYIIRPTSNYVGLFGYIYHATIDSLGLTNDSIVGNSYVGGLFGSSYYSRISYCYTTGIVRANNSVCGGFGGGMYATYTPQNASTCVSCYSRADVFSSGNTVGGFLGQLNGSVKTCYCSGNVLGTDYTGGFVGFVSFLDTLINCYARGMITGHVNVGGFAGWAEQGKTENCYCTGFVSGVSRLAGFLGYDSYGNYAVNQSYFDTISTGQTNGVNNNSPLGCEGKSTEEMEQQSTFVNWDFKDETINGTKDIWVINSAQNDGYPLFYEPISISTLALTDSTDCSVRVRGKVFNFWEQGIVAHGVCWNTSGNPNLSDNFTDLGSLNTQREWETEITGLTRITTYYVRTYAISTYSDTVYGETLSFRTTLPGKGSENDPYLVYTYSDLKGLKYNRGAYYKQMADINAVESQSENGGEGFEPVGSSSNMFTGVYLGQAFIIDSLTINRSGSDNIGLFGYLSGAKIIDLGLSNVTINGNQNVGGIAGMLDSNSEIRKCYVSGSVFGANYYAGGLAGYVSYSSVSLSYSTSSVTVTGQQGYAGGLIGKTDHSTLDNCYATGTVTIPGIPLYAAGLVAYNGLTNISKCYSTGLVAASNFLGGAVGGLLAFNNSTVSNSFWDVQTSGKSTSAGGTGKTTTQMKTLTTFTNAGWDFYGESVNGSEDHWDMNVSINSGYPYLRMDFYPAALTTELESQYLDFVVVKGGITNLGNPLPVQHGICWNTTGTPTINDHKTEEGLIETIGDFYSTATGLEVNTTYYLRAYMSNRSGTIYGNEISVQTSNQSGGCAYFDGVDALIRIDKDPGISVGNTFSVEVWVKPLSLSLRYVVYSTIKYAGLGSGYQIEIGPGNNGTNCVGVYNTGTWYAQTENNVIEINKWNHIVYSRESGTQQNIYVNGSQVSLVTTNSGTISDRDYDRAIGDGLSTSVHNFYGYIDEVRIWNYALTQEEVRERMYKSLSGEEPGLVEYWKFDKRSGLSTSDEKVNRTGTLVSMDSTAFIASTAPIPFVSDGDGIWADDNNWLSGQGSPANAWSRVQVNSNLVLDNDMELIFLEIATGKSLTISAGHHMELSGGN